MLEAVDLVKHYGKHEALKGLNLQVQPGEIYCLLGANGAGKTTTINLFLDFIHPTSGKATVNGINVADDPVGSKRYLAYIPEQVMLYGTLTGLENLRYFSRLGSHDHSDDEYRRLLVESGLDAGAADKPVSAYSKGMRQKVGVAIALAKEAKALLLDEPTSGLDPKASNEFSALLLKLRDAGAAILMTSHDLFRAKDTGTRIGIMREGVLLDELDGKQVSHGELENIYLDHMAED
ncbi:MAG: ABC transporter ATP-binding protein [Gammaproteobacteria bacterium]